MFKKILYIHQDKRLRTGAHYINNLIVKGLRQTGYEVDNIYPEENLELFGPSLKGIKNILFFYSLIERKKDIHKYDIIQGTTYTPLAFIHSRIPVISMFGSTTYGFLNNVPSLKILEKEHTELAEIFSEMKEKNIISGLLPLIQPIRDISKIEIYVAKNASRVIATSEHVKNELIKNGVRDDKITIIHNGIENFWFRTKPPKRVKPVASIVYLGRMGEDAFTVKLKGINRMIFIMRRFPNNHKRIIGLTKKTEEYGSLFQGIPNSESFFNKKRRKIKQILRHHYGDIYINPGRYEGFSLTLIESMSQGLVPVTFPVGVAPEIIKNGENGFIVHSLRQMMNKIQALESNKNLRTKLARTAMETSRQFTLKAMIDKYIKVYDEVISEEYGVKVQTPKNSLEPAPEYP